MVWSMKSTTILFDLTLIKCARCPALSNLCDFPMIPFRILLFGNNAMRKVRQILEQTLYYLTETDRIFLVCYVNIILWAVASSKVLLFIFFLPKLIETIKLTRYVQWDLCVRFFNFKKSSASVILARVGGVANSK